MQLCTTSMRRMQFNHMFRNRMTDEVYAGMQLIITRNEYTFV